MWPRLARLVVAVAAPIVPRALRGRWRDQWTADLAHRAQGLARAGLAGGRAGRALAVRALGAIPHAFALRLEEIRPAMLLVDLHHAWRSVLRRPAFAATAVLTVALGIGATAVIFSWTEALLLNPLGGVGGQDRLVVVTATTATRDDLSWSYPSFLDVREQRLPSLVDLAVFRSTPMSLRTGAASERVWGQLVSGNLFEMLGVRPALGRVLQPADSRASGGEAVVVLGHAFWQRRFAGRPDVVGSPLIVNGQPFTVVGVAAPGFRGTLAALEFDLFVPVTMQGVFMPGDRLQERGHRWLEGMARLRPGATLDAAQADLALAARRLADAHPVVQRGRGLRAHPLWRSPTGSQRMMMPVMAVLGAIVSLLLLLVCVNLAGLLLARGASRRREVAVRLALGSGRGRLVRQLLLESLVLAVAGGAVGTFVARWSGAIFSAFLPPLPLPVNVEAGVNLPVLLFAMAISVVAGVAFGIAPAMHASRQDLTAALKEGSGSSQRWRRRGLRQALVVAQVALALVLLVAASLFVRTMWHARDLDPGFATRDGVIASIDLLPAGYDAQRGPDALRRIAASVASVPGVEAVALARRAPLSPFDSSDRAVDIEGYTPAPEEELSIHYNQVSDGYFATVRLPIVRGREFEARDTAEAPPVVVINETMAQRYWRGREALGGRIRMGEAWATVVGIARDSKYASINEPRRPYMYLPLGQAYRPDVRIVTRTADAGAGVASALRTAVAAVDPDIPLAEVLTIREHLAFSTFLFEVVATVLGVFGQVAMLLAGLGLYGVMALSVSQRTRELGVRASLGAQARDLRRLVVRQGLTLTVLGLAIGLATAAALARLLARQLVGVGPYDPLSYGLPVLVLLAAAFAASYLPARRASRVDPVIALRTD